MEEAFDCDVLIAGYGPVGATLAALLGQSGISVLVVEPERAIYPLPRAAHLDHEILRIFQTIGIQDSVAPHMRPAPDYEFCTANGAMLMRIEREGVLGASGWPVSVNVYQPGIEAAIRAAVAALPNVRLVMGHRVTGFGQDRDSVRVSLQANETTTELRARFLIGCDGARSPVREACGIALHDYCFDEPWLVLDARVADESGFPRMNLQICDPARPTSFVHMGPGRLRWEFMLKAGETADAIQQDRQVEALLAPWRRMGAITVERRAVYRFHGLIAHRWRHGRVFLAGDAAHQMPPFMGQGLCAGLRDAANLAWKLRAAIDGDAIEALLESYQAEREPHVRHVVEKAIEMGHLVCTLDPEMAASRDAAMLQAPTIRPPMPFPPFGQGCVLHDTPAAGAIFPQPVDNGGNYLDDDLGLGAWLLHRGPAPLMPPPGLRIVNVANMPRWGAQIKCWLDTHSVDAVLIRPDRVVFGSGAADWLADGYRAWFTNERQGGGPAVDLHYDAALSRCAKV